MSGRRTPRKYLHMNMQKAREARRMYFQERRKQREIAEVLGCTQSTVSRIISDLTWLDV